MKKIPTLFVRDPDTNFRYVSRAINPEAQWVIDGEGIPTRKYDGTCVMLDSNGHWWARRETKIGKPVPSGFLVVHSDLDTGKAVGWEPIEQSGFYKFFNEALKEDYWEPGTFELVGPKINRNPEGTTTHVLIRHADAEVLDITARDYDGLRLVLSGFPGEGIVWHHPDGRMAKLKRRDFPPVEAE
jgi:hypothetical protein